MQDTDLQKRMQVMEMLQRILHIFYRNQITNEDERESGR